MIRANLNGVWFIASRATKDCASCLFETEKARVCSQACRAAMLAGMPDCDDKPGYIYREYADELSQMDLLDAPRD